jgi:hypothetical protein
MAALSGVATGWATEMARDPKGYDGTAWGSPYSPSRDFVKVDEVGRIQTYEYAGDQPTFGAIPVASVKVFTVSGQFARVMVRYQGKGTHEQVMRYIQSLYGPIDRTPGAMTRGPGQQFNWRGADTEVNLTYETLRELGYIFIDSAILAPRFNDSLPEHGY